MCGCGEMIRIGLAGEAGAGLDRRSRVCGFMVMFGLGLRFGFVGRDIFDVLLDAAGLQPAAGGRYSSLGKAPAAKSLDPPSTELH